MAFLPENTSRLFTTLNLMPGPTPEPAVTNQAFLYSFLDAGVWMRCLTMQAHVVTLADKDASRLQRLAASVGVYQQMGLAIEDALVTLISWSVWASDKSASLPDIASRMLLRTSQGDEYSRTDIAAFADKFKTGKRVFVDGRRYVRALVQDQPLNHLPALFGVNWKAQPSVNLVPQEEILTWSMLPRSIAEHVKLLTDSSSELVTAYSNKLKHGPQLIVDNPKDACLRMEHAGEDVGSVPDTELVRILLNGSQRSTTPEQLAAGARIAPFLLRDSTNAARILRRSLLDGAGFLYALGLYLFRTTFRDAKTPDVRGDPGLQELARSHFEDL